MNNFFRAIIAGYGAKKLGGGCFGTIIVFILIWVALGQCSLSSREVPPPETYPADRRAVINWESPCNMITIFDPEQGWFSNEIVASLGLKEVISQRSMAGLDEAIDKNARLQIWPEGLSG